MSRSSTSGLGPSRDSTLQSGRYQPARESHPLPNLGPYSQYVPVPTDSLQRNTRYPGGESRDSEFKEDPYFGRDR